MCLLPLTKKARLNIYDMCESQRLRNDVISSAHKAVSVHPDAQEHSQISMQMQMQMLASVWFCCSHIACVLALL